MLYDGIKLDLPNGPVSMSHSHAMDIIRGQSGDQNMDWMEALGSLPWGDLKESHPEHFAHASKIFSLSSMDYQVCNGGIFQYFDNRYHEGRDPYSEHDVERFDIDVQKEFFEEVVSFAKAVYPERQSENAALEKACNAFNELWFEEDAKCIETVYCDEDAYIYDDELEEDVPNPDYFEPYDETVYQDVIHNDNGFDDTFYEASDYLEELLEMQSQLCCKKLAVEFQKDIQQNSELADPELVKKVKEILPASAFVKPSLAEKIQSASGRASENTGHQTQSIDHTGR